VRAGAGSWGQVEAATNGHDVKSPRQLAKNRALGALWEVSVLSFQTGGRAGAECVAVSVVASVPATSRAAGFEVARQRHGAAVGAAWALARAFECTSTTCGSRGEGRVVVAWHVMEWCRLRTAVADVGRAVVVLLCHEWW